MASRGVRVVLALFALLAGMPAIDAAIAPDPARVRPSITIEGDAGFHDPASGVRGGSGTAEDPFVISGWTILQDRPWGIRLRNTTAHVVLADVELLPCPVGCVSLDALDASFDILAGVHLEDAANVSVLRLVVPGEREIGAYVVRSSDVRLVDVRTSSLGGGLNGVFAADSPRLHVLRPRVSGYAVDLAFLRTDDLVVEGADIHWPPEPSIVRGIYVDGPLRGFTLRDSRLANASLLARGAIADAWIHGNEVHNGSLGRGSFAFYTDARICGNRLHGSDIRGGDARNVTIRGNLIERGRFGIFIGPGDGLTIEGNVVRGTTDRGVWANARTNATTSPPLLVHGNAIEGNAIGAYLPSDGSDARFNWWGHPSGPSGLGGGTGDSLVTLPGRSPLYEPWLTERPGLALACG